MLLQYDLFDILRNNWVRSCSLEDNYMQRNLQDFKAEMDCGGMVGGGSGRHTARAAWDDRQVPVPSSATLWGHDSFMSCRQCSERYILQPLGEEADGVRQGVCSGQQALKLLILGKLDHSRQAWSPRLFRRWCPEYHVPLQGQERVIFGGFWPMRTFVQTWLVNYS